MPVLSFLLNVKSLQCMYSSFLLYTLIEYVLFFLFRGGSYCVKCVVKLCFLLIKNMILMSWPQSVLTNFQFLVSFGMTDSGSVVLY